MPIVTVTTLPVIFVTVKTVASEVAATDVLRARREPTSNLIIASSERVISTVVAGDTGPAAITEALAAPRTAI